MALSKSKAVQDFLIDLETIDSKSFDTLSKIREIIFHIHPKANEKVMYGGIVFLLNDQMFSGVFVYKNHVSLEFSNGFQMSDPNNLLEGNGKYRRHLKLTVAEDITNKHVFDFVKQALI